MEVLNWAGLHWLDLLQSLGIIAGLWFTAYTIREEEQARKIGHLITIAQHHREIWGELYERPELARILRRDVNLKDHPVSGGEQLFVNFVIIHLDTVHQAMNGRMFVRMEGMREDIGQFFTLPIVAAVWAKSKRLQNPDFVRFIESCRSEH